MYIDDLYIIGILYNLFFFVKKTVYSRGLYCFKMVDKFELGGAVIELGSLQNFFYIDINQV